MKKKLIAFACSSIISVNCLTFNSVDARVLEPEIIKYETWDASYFIDNCDSESLYPYLKCVFAVYNNGDIKFKLYNAHEFDGFSNIKNDIYFPYITNDHYNFSVSYYKEIENTETYSSEFVSYTPERDFYSLVLGYSRNNVNYSTDSEYISLNDTDIRECIPIHTNSYDNKNTCLSVGDYFKWACITGSTTKEFPDKFVCDATCTYYNDSLTTLDENDMFFNIVYHMVNNIERFDIDTAYRKGLSLDVSYTDSYNNCDNYTYVREYPLYRITAVSLAELGSYRGFEYDDGLIVEYNVAKNKPKFPTEDITYTIFGKTITVPASIYANPDNTADKQLTAEQQYVRDLERQLNETRSELEKYQALDYNNDGKITALDAQMMLTYYAESLACDTNNDVSGYGEFVRNYDN